MTKSEVRWAPGGPGFGQVGDVYAMLSLILCPVLQVATDRPLREEELPHRPRHSPLTLCPPLLEGSPLHRASHRAMAHPRNSVSPGAMVGLCCTPFVYCLVLAWGSCNWELVTVPLPGGKGWAGLVDYTFVDFGPVVG